MPTILDPQSDDTVELDLPRELMERGARDYHDAEGECVLCGKTTTQMANGLADVFVCTRCVSF